MKLSDLHGRFREHAEASGVKTSAPIRARRGVMNKWEASFAAGVLTMRLRAGEIARWDFESTKFNVGDGSWYCPDFRVVMPDQKIVFFEVKGYRHAAGIVKLKAASKMFPEHQFVLVTGKGGGWEYTPVG